MFTLTEDEPSYLAFFVQQLGVPLVSLIAVLLFSQVLPAFPLLTPTATMTNGWFVLAACLFGFSMALLLRRLSPEFTANGRWIWIGPSGILLAFSTADLPRHTVSEIFTEAFNPYGPELGWIFVLLTLPCIASLAYSFAASHHLWAAFRVYSRFSKQPRDADGRLTPSTTSPRT